MRPKHRDRRRYIEAIVMRRDLDAQRQAWEGGRHLRDVVGASKVRGLLEQIHAAEHAACQDAECIPWIEQLHRNEMAGLDGRDPVIESTTYSP